MQLNDLWGAQFVILLTAKRLEKDLYLYHSFFLQNYKSKLHIYNF